MGRPKLKPIGSYDRDFWYRHSYNVARWQLRELQILTAAQIRRIDQLERLRLAIEDVLGEPPCHTMKPENDWCENGDSLPFTGHHCYVDPDPGPRIRYVDRPAAGSEELDIAAELDSRQPS
jgi:hypothetical protein